MAVRGCILPGDMKGGREVAVESKSKEVRRSEDYEPSPGTISSREGRVPV